MSTVKVVINPVGFNRVFRSPNGPIGRDFHNRCQKLAWLARGQIGVDSARAFTGISVHYHKTPSGDLAANIGVNPRGRLVGYAYFHHEGTERHQIPRPGRPSKVLAFPSGGATIFRSSVNHPGTQPNRYLSDNVRRAFG